ncbi:hypothetical protein MXAN_6378 [Myxococcus xanthus DK 1622]|uniref:Uncharacterized protein n=1 Tax=Myxococcus xanthus (strain DK1622) TaxID=246197 RepID=Q1CYM2_MYXXD|nr:hypothetical protein MXAN_6378 [Myxococcus xanthus DK 1622]
MSELASSSSSSSLSELASFSFSFGFWAFGVGFFWRLRGLFSSRTSAQSSSSDSTQGWNSSLESVSEEDPHECMAMWRLQSGWPQLRQMLPSATWVLQRAQRAMARLRLRQVQCLQQLAAGAIQLPGGLQAIRQLQPLQGLASHRVVLTVLLAAAEVAQVRQPVLEPGEGAERVHVAELELIGLAVGPRPEDELPQVRIGRDGRLDIAVPVQLAPDVPDALPREGPEPEEEGEPHPGLFVDVEEAQPQHVGNALAAHPVQASGPCLLVSRPPGRQGDGVSGVQHVALALLRVQHGILRQVPQRLRQEAVLVGDAAHAVSLVDNMGLGDARRLCGRCLLPRGRNVTHGPLRRQGLLGEELPGRRVQVWQAQRVARVRFQPLEAGTALTVGPGPQELARCQPQLHLDVHQALVILAHHAHLQGPEASQATWHAHPVRGRGVALPGRCFLRGLELLLTEDCLGHGSRLLVKAELALEPGAVGLQLQPVEGVLHQPVQPGAGGRHVRGREHGLHPGVARPPVEVPAMEATQVEEAAQLPPAREPIVAGGLECALDVRIQLACFQPGGPLREVGPQVLHHLPSEPRFACVLEGEALLRADDEGGHSIHSCRARRCEASASVQMQPGRHSGGGRLQGRRRIGRRALRREGTRAAFSLDAGAVAAWAPAVSAEPLPREPRGRRRT